MKRTCVVRQSVWCVYIYLHECVFVHLPPPSPLPSSLLSAGQEMNQRFIDCLGQIRAAQNLVAIELGNWKQTQRMFSWEDDRGKSELSNIQQW